MTKIYDTSYLKIWDWNKEFYLFEYTKSNGSFARARKEQVLINKKAIIALYPKLIGELL